MGARILRIELRRSVALWAAVVIAAVGVFVLFSSNEPYGSWMQLVIVQRDIMQLTWPLALAAGAWQGIRERRSRVEELLATTPRPRWRRVLPVATAMAVAAVAAYLVMLAGAAGHLRHIDGYFPLGAIPLIALGALAMVAAVWLGQSIGTLLPSPLTAPMLAVIGFVGLAVSPMVVAQDSGDPGTFLLFPYLQGPRDGGFAIQMLSARANLSQALWLAALAATGLAVFAASRPSTRVAALLPVALGAAVAVPVMPRHLSVAWIEDHRATEVVCTDDEPKVCIARLHSYALDHVTGPAREALSVLAAKLPPAPTKVLVDTVGDKDPVDQRPPDTLVARVSSVDDIEDYGADNLLWLMLDGAGVPPCRKFMNLKGEPDDRHLAARLVAAAWLLDRALPPAGGRDNGSGLAHEALTTLRGLPADEQRTRVAALRDAERACADGDRLEMLTGTSTAR
ncbi:MAG: hypothetical protein ACM30G_09405 [Micromonosporaceae bacterium]